MSFNPSPPIQPPEITVASQTAFQGSFITFRQDTVRLENGEERTRDVIMHPGGVVVLPVLEDGRILFIEQYRHPIAQTLLELPAGKLEPGEDPFEAIQRELLEETGYTAAHWEPMSYVYTAPGFCDEKLYLYKATGLTQIADPHGDEDEFITLKPLTLQEANDALRQGLLTDAKSICLLHRLQLA